MLHQRADLPLKLDSESAAQAFFAGCFKGTDTRRERLWVAHVDEQSRCIHLSHHDGSESETDFPLRSILRDAVQHSTVGLVLAHNHPSGDARPSESDCRSTRRLASAAEAIDCTILDHLIFANGDCSSLRRLGYI